MLQLHRTDPFSLLPGPHGLDRARRSLGFFDKSYETLRGLHQDHGDLVAINVFGQRLVSVANPEWIDRVLRDPDAVLIKDRVLRDLRTLLGEGLLTAENPLWIRQRRLIAPALQRRQVLAYASAMRRLMREMMATWHDGQHVDLHAAWMLVTLRIVAQTLFATQVREDEATIAAALEEAMLHLDRELHTPLGLLPMWVQTPSRRMFLRSVAIMDRVVFRLIQERRARGDKGDDLLGRMMFAKDDAGNSMSDQQLRDEVLTLFLAGHETTALTMTWTMMLLSHQPHVAARLREEIAQTFPDPDDDSAVGTELNTRLPYTVAVLRESMRLYPPAWIVGRESTQDITLGHHVVPKGCQVLTSTWVMHRDPRYFDDPLVFRPERWLDGLYERLPRGVYFPFGGGPRVCIGNHFAMMEAAILLTEMVRNWEFEVDANYVPKLVPSITLRPRFGLPGTLRRVGATRTLP